MKFLGQPFVIQNTDEGWLVQWTDAVVHGVPGKEHERVSFTVQIPRRADLTISEVQVFAMKRAAELLQSAIDHRGTSPGAP